MKILTMLFKVLTVLLGAAWIIVEFILDVWSGSVEKDEDRIHIKNTSMAPEDIVNNPDNAFYFRRYDD